jgi:quercetin dioxygenase-like cupin family protein
MNKTRIALLLSAIAAAGLFAGRALATPPSGVTPTTLAKSLFNQFEVRDSTDPANTWQAMLRTLGQSDVYVVDNVLLPGASTGWHSHPGPSLVLVVHGTVTDYSSLDPTCQGTRITEGSGFVDQGGSEVHMVRNETSSQAEVIAVQILPHGAPRRIDEPEPANCHI